MAASLHPVIWKVIGRKVIWNDLPLELHSLQSLSVFKNEVLNYWHTDS